MRLITALLRLLRPARPAPLGEPGLPLTQVIVFTRPDGNVNVYPFTHAEIDGEDLILHADVPAATCRDGRVTADDGWCGRSFDVQVTPGQVRLRGGDERRGSHTLKHALTGRAPEQVHLMLG